MGKFFVSLISFIASSTLSYAKKPVDFVLVESMRQNSEAHSDSENLREGDVIQLPPYSRSFTVPDSEKPGCRFDIKDVKPGDIVNFQSPEIGRGVPRQFKLGKISTVRGNSRTQELPLQRAVSLYAQDTNSSVHSSALDGEARIEDADSSGYRHVLEEQTGILTTTEFTITMEIKDNYNSFKSLICVYEEDELTFKDTGKKVPIAEAKYNDRFGPLTKADLSRPKWVVANDDEFMLKGLEGGRLPYNGIIDVLDDYGIIDQYQDKPLFYTKKPSESKSVFSIEKKPKVDGHI